MTWHFATAFEVIADAIGDSPALICEDQVRSWSQYDDRAARMARVLSDHGLGVESKVGIYLHNCNEYMETYYGALKLRACPINVNYRYLEDELVYLLENSDAEAVIFQATYADRIAAIRHRLADVKCFLQVSDDSCNALVEGAVDYEEAIAAADPLPRIERSGDDLLILYTGGTTGLPKGVMYNIGEMCRMLLGVNELFGSPVPETLDELAAAASLSREQGSAPSNLVCCPLMHGTGIFTGAVSSLLATGTAIFNRNLGLDPDLLWQQVSEHRASAMTIVGDAFARPMLAALDDAKAKGKPYDISSLRYVMSSGTMFSREVKEGLLGHHPMMLIDAMAASEGNMGSSVTTRETLADTAQFQVVEGVSVFSDSFEKIKPGSGEIGIVGTPSPMIGYYGDPEKTAETIREIGGVRYVFPGDFATIEEDGTVTLLGRGSNCINTAGEKVFPEEVEEALKTHDAVSDCLVVGVPDERFGSKVVGVLSLNRECSEENLREHCHEKLAGYKVPKNLLFVERVQRVPNGKADYKWAAGVAEKML